MLSPLLLNHAMFVRNVMNNFLHINGYFKNTLFCAQMCQWTNLMFKSPCLELQEYIEVPVMNKSISYFNPTQNLMKSALKLFTPKVNHSITCISRTVYPEKFPTHSLPEVAFLGQSNSGKSSLLKAVFNNVPDLGIRTSKKPGHTKCLAFYNVGQHLCLVDMPGYGQNQPEWFESSVVHYLKNRKNLLRTFMLIDSRKGFNAWDDATLQMIQDFKIPFAVVLTKIDGIAASERMKAFLHVQNMIVNKEKSCFPQIFMLSSTTFEGLAFFLAFLAHITGNLSADST